MSLLSYKSTFPWAASIKARVLALSMPPWFADERYGVFHGASTLSASEMNTIVDWCVGGTPEGDSASEPAASRAPDASAEKPDLLVDLPVFTLAAGTKRDIYEARVETGLERDRLLAGIDFRPERANVLRSALLFIVPKRSSPGAPIASWVAGDSAFLWPEGRGVRIPAGSSIVVRIHYEKTWLDEGKEIRDQSALALYFEKGKARPVESLVLTVKGGESLYPLSRRVEVLSLLPQLEAPLDAIQADAVLPDGTSRPLIRLRRPDPSWPRTYRLEEPLILPKGSRVRVMVTSSDEASLHPGGALVLNVVGK